MTCSVALFLLLLPLWVCPGLPGWSAPNPTGWSVSNCTARQVATLPVRFDLGLILVPARINGRPVLMAVDTGSTQTMIFDEAVDRLGLQRDTQRQTSVDGVGGVAQTRNAQVATFEFAGRTLTEQSIPTGTLGAEFSNGIFVAGLLGANTLSRYEIQLNGLNQRMTLWSVDHCAGDFVTWNRPHDVLPLLPGRGGLIYAAVLVNGVPLRAMIDWGSTASLMTRHAALRLGVGDDTLAGDPVAESQGIDRRTIETHAHRFNEIRIGSQTLYGARLDVGDFRFDDADMVLGMDYARARRIWLSYKTSQMFVSTTLVIGPDWDRSPVDPTPADRQRSTHPAIRTEEIERPYDLSPRIR